MTSERRAVDSVFGMRAHHRLLLSALLTAVLAVALVAPAAAREAGTAPAAPAVSWQQAESERDVKPVTIWALVGVGLLLASLGILYLLKRELGGFEPKPGGWTAPITVIRSRELAVEESDFPADDGDDHGH